MKRFYLLIAVFALTTPLLAQYNPSVYLFSKSAGPLSDTSELAIIRLYDITHQTGFQQIHKPNFILSGGKNFSLGISGFVNARTAYDFDGIVNSQDFITYDIPVPGSYTTKDQLFMDASTSRLAFKAIANSKCLGPIVAYLETDFRGANQNLRMRIGYISFKGFLFGRNVTTFCDLDAAPTTIDFQGPNAYTFNFNNMIRYTHTFNDNRWKVGIALEMPQISATTTSNLQTIPQRVPDIPAYVQYNWGKGRDSHLRLSGLLRTLTYHNIALDKNHNTTGWAVQMSNITKLSPKVSFTAQATYGEGITPYVCDLNDSGLDIVPNLANTAKMAAVPTFGWFGSLQYNITPQLFVSGGYSQVRVYKEDNFSTNNEYRLGQYCFGNVFWNITPYLQVAVEYLYGTRKNMDMDKNHANRLQTMIQYNF